MVWVEGAVTSHSLHFSGLADCCKAITKRTFVAIFRTRHTQSMAETGTLYLIPTPLGDEGLPGISGELTAVLHRLDYFIVERGKTARQFLKRTGFPRPLQDLEFVELNEHTPDNAMRDLLEPLLQGRDAGLLSEAGCPAVADPGSGLVWLAHQHGVPVVPVVGPSAILLALMASGLNGQVFAFHGYLAVKKPELAQQLRRLEQQSTREKRTQVFIETPYRSMQMLEILIQVLQADTRLSVAVDLTMPGQLIHTRTIAQWRGLSALPTLHKRPAVFSFLAT